MAAEVQSLVRYVAFVKELRYWYHFLDTAKKKEAIDDAVVRTHWKIKDECQTRLSQLRGKVIELETQMAGVERASLTAVISQGGGDVAEQLSGEVSKTKN